MKLLLPLLGLLVVSTVQALSVKEAMIVGSQGLDEETPIAVDDTFSLKCDIQLQSEEAWLLCMWTHTIEGRTDSNGMDLKAVCSTSPDGNNQCTNKGGSSQLDSYASRITMMTSPNSCGINVRGAVGEDDGQWECHVTDASTGGGQVSSYLDIHVANQTTIFITEPRIEQDSSLTIEYDLEETRSEIEATCRGYGGKPKPTFRWYINDDRNEIPETAMTKRIRSSKDNLLGEYDEERISFQPTLEDFCTRYDIDEYACETSKTKYHYFNFNLICKVEQEGYFQRENEDQEAVVQVDVVSGSSIQVASLVMILTSFLAMLVVC